MARTSAVELAATTLVNALCELGARDMTVTVRGCRDDDGNDLGDFQVAVTCVRDPEDGAVAAEVVANG